MCLYGKFRNQSSRKKAGQSAVSQVLMCLRVRFRAVDVRCPSVLFVKEHGELVRLAPQEQRDKSVFQGNGEGWRTILEDVKVSLACSVLCGRCHKRKEGNVVAGAGQDKVLQENQERDYKKVQEAIECMNAEQSRLLATMERKHKLMCGAQEEIRRKVLLDVLVWKSSCSRQVER